MDLNANILPVVTKYLAIFYRDAISTLLQLVNQWLNFTHVLTLSAKEERKDTNCALTRIELMTSATSGCEQVTYYTNRATIERM